MKSITWDLKILTFIDEEPLKAGLLLRGSIELSSMFVFVRYVIFFRYNFFSGVEEGLDSALLSEVRLRTRFLNECS